MLEVGLLTRNCLVPEISRKAIPLDFIFVIDSSRSIRPHDYKKVKTFIINLLQFLAQIPPEWVCFSMAA